MSKLRLLLITILVLFAILFFSSAQIGIAQEGTLLPPTSLAPTSPAQPTASVDELLIRLDSLEKRADSAVNFANSLLNIFQIVGILVTIVGILFAVGIFRQVQQVDTEWTKFKDDYFGNTVKIGKFQELSSQIDSRLSAMQTSIDAASQLTHDSESVLQSMRNISQETEAKLTDLKTTGRNQNEALALAQLGQQQIALGNLELATEFYEQAYKLDQDNEVMRFFLGDLYVRLERLTEGIALLEQSVTYAPARLSLAYAKRLLGDAQQDPDQRRALYGEAERLFSEERLHGKRNKALLDITGESAYGALASLLKRQGRNEEAYELYEEVATLTPQSSYPVTNLGILAYRIGNVEKARVHFERSLKLAKQRIIRDNDDYYAWHDRVTASVVLSHSLSEILTDLDEAFAVTPGIEPLRKLERGLRDLAAIKDGPRYDEQIAQRIDAEIKRRAQP